MVKFSVITSTSIRHIKLVYATLLFFFNVGVASAMQVCTTNFEPEVLSTPIINVATLNIAHGRGDGINQVLLSKRTIVSNLNSVAEVIRPLSIDIFALQEADAPSKWSGGFNHVQHLAAELSMPCYILGSHASSLLFDYGTALLARTGLRNTYSHQFKPSPPTLNKGYVAGSVLWNPGEALPEPMEVTFVSVHLDFSRNSVRHSQINEIIEKFSDTNGLFVLMGDFNTDIDDPEGVLSMLAKHFQLRLYKPHSPDLGTYVSRDTRLDWILISPELDFARYEVLPDIVSDHLIVSAGIVPLSARKSTMSENRPKHLLEASR